MPSVLIVDDEANIRRLFRRVLEAEGAEVDEAGNGREALDRLDQRPFDVLLTDIIMPEMEGIETIMTVRREQPDIRVVAISGGGTVDAGQYLSMARGLGAHAVLTKPVSKNDLVAAVLGPEGHDGQP